ncbi:acyl-CoA dehydrogenase family protein [Bradyrhizobium liaoningense]|uniref:acyl-CoA dehydrogenase family protein n=1 Tax=Bradyrhizobium liaoningense TaxID=43992 RepID=UPI001BA5472E|nr:acyl-CoA dehydrogenase [Bradyrhizobium liaoningense]MBR0838932.1 acyl-CoA dehydrogenase family protein [Bradyrhizobium liaoningense]MBR0854484.1 acyl-CoA dehydrogenase family protein [Bradyrhizobium liaoningense]
MDLAPTEAQHMLRHSVERFVVEHYGSATRRNAVQAAEGFKRDNWRRFADLGWLGLPFAEEIGGFGGGPPEVAILMEELGRGLATEPYLSTVLLGGALIAECGTEEQQGSLLPDIINGERLLSFAHYETDARAGLSAVRMTGRSDHHGWTLHGRKIAVFDASSSDIHIASAQLPDAQGGGLALFLVPRDTAGVGLREAPRLGGGRVAELTFEEVRLPLHARLGTRADALPAIEAVVDRAIAAVGAQACGLMRAMFDATLEYTKVRKQFGRPLAANQVIRHRLADMYVQCEEARAMAARAALLVGVDTNPTQRMLAASGAKVKIGRCARNVAEQAIQLHGAMGVTDELDLGLYFKQLLVFEALFGSVDFHLQRHTRLFDNSRPE